MLAFLSGVIGSEAGGAILLPLTIILCAIFSEDITTVVVGLLAADGVVPIVVVFPALYAGVVIADLLLYGLGWLARTHPRLTRYIDHDATLPLRSWLENRYAFSVFSGHFIPGLRFTTYVASGFFRYPLSTYIPMALAGGLVLLSALFSVSYWFGSFTAKWLGPARWGVALVFVLVLFIVGRHNLLAYRANKTLPDTGADTRVP